MKNFMQKAAVLTAGLLMAVSTTQIANAAEAQPFQVTLPTGVGTFANSSQTAKSPSGDIKISNWISKSPTGEAIVISVTKMTGKILNPGQQMSNTTDALVKSVNAMVDSQEKIDGPVPALRVKFHTASAYMRARLMVQGDELYQILYVGRTPEQPANPAVDTLFQSFAITRPPAAATASAQQPQAATQPQTAAAAPTVH